MGRIRNIFLFTVKLAAVAAAAATLMSALACCVKHWLFQMFGLVFVIIFIANIVILVILRLARSKFAYISLAALVVSLLYIGRFVQFSGGKASDGDKTLKVITYNVRGFNNVSNGKTSYGEIADFMLSEDADIICMQEYSLSATVANRSMQKLHRKYPHASKSYQGQKIFSKYPLIGSRHLSFAGTSVAVADININGDTVRIYSCHLQSTRFNPDHTRQRLTAASKSYLKELRRVVVNLRRAFINRAAQAELIAESIEKSPYPTVVCGDFNDTPMSYAYQKIRGDMSDAFVEAGAGLSSTYRRIFSILRIDYVFTHKNMAAVEYAVAKEVKCSDHYPVVVKIKMKNEE